jgi:hypothetical protein
MVVLAALGCGEGLTAPSVTPPAPAELVTRIACTANVGARQVDCATSAPPPPAIGFKGFTPEGIARDIILGGQNNFVTLASSGVTYTGDVFSFNATVQNRIAQSLGTTDGTTLAPSGVRVFFENPPVMLTGSGTIDYTNPVGGASMVDGFASFTSSNQAYYQYSQILAPNQTSSPRNWRLHVPASVTSFEFYVYVSAPVQFATGWIDLAPSSATLAVGATTTLVPTVRDAVGRTLSGQTVTFASGNTGVATVNSSTGVVTAVSGGTATITATSTTRTGTALITVSSASGMTINAGHQQTALVGATVATAPSVVVRDQNGNPMSNVSVTFSVTGGGGSATGLTTTTDGSGVATVGSWTLGAGGAGCTKAAITNCTRNTLHAVANAGSNPAIDIVGYVPPLGVPSTVAYQAVGNATLTIGAAQGLLATAFSINGSGANGSGVTPTVLSVGTTANGVATAASDGSFTYLTTPGYTNGAGTDDHALVVTDGVATTNSSGVVSFNVPTRVWYVQPGYVGTSSGTDVQPYKDFSGTAGTGVQSTSAASDVILVQTGSGSAAGGTLLASQTVYGQGESAAFTRTLGSSATYVNHDAVLTLLATGTAPQVGALVLGNSNTLRGLTLNGSTIALSGSGIGTLTLSETSISTTGQALSLTNGTANATFSAVSSSSGTNNVALTTIAGSVALGSGALSGASGTSFLVSGGTSDVTYAGTITKTSSGQLLSIATHTTGNITLSGNLSCTTSCGSTSGSVAVSGVTSGIVDFSGTSKTITVTGTNVGVQLTSNTGGTIRFSNGGLFVSSATGSAFAASGGGTISVANGSAGTPNSTLSSAGAAALNVANTTIATSPGLNFFSVAATGGVNGIVLNSTGSGPLLIAGNFPSSSGNTTKGRTTVGSGGTATLGSGGTITGTSGAALSLTTAGTVTLRNMVIQNSTTDGISATSLSSLNLDNTLVSNNTAYGIRATSLSGASLQHTEISGNANVSLSTNHNADFAGTSGAVVVGNSLFQNSYLETLRMINTSGSGSLTITNSGFNNSTNGEGVAAIAQTSGGVALTLNGSTMNGNRQGVRVEHGGSGSSTFNIQGNNIQSTSSGSGHAIEIVRPTGSTGGLSGIINANTIGTAGVANSGSGAGNGVAVSTIGDLGTIRVTITNNVIRQYGTHGIGLTAGQASSGHTLEAKVQGNNIANPAAIALDGVNATIGTLNTDHVSVCLNIVSNTVVNSPRNGVRVRPSGLPAAPTTLRLEGWDGVTAGTTYLANNNPAATGVTANTSFTNSTGTTTSAACTTP